MCRGEVERLEAELARLAACRVEVERLAAAWEVIAGRMPAPSAAAAAMPGGRKTELGGKCWPSWPRVRV